MGETKKLSSTEKLNWLRLIRSENVGPITFFKLLERFGSAAKALEALPEMSRRGGGAKSIKVCTKAAAEDEMAALESLGSRFIARIEADYPPLLYHIDDAPPLLSVRGNGHLLKKKAVGVVGARNASLNGRRFACKLAGDLGREGLLVVSGLARGIDASAHEGALETGTVAVVAGGVDVIYPKENTRLYGQILEQGAIVSECAPGEAPTARHFPRRNRLISGMSRGVVVVEAARRSGSLITARMALEQDRYVFAVPGSPLDTRTGGANDLIRQGAYLTETAEDVVRILDDLFRDSLAERKVLDLTGATASIPCEDELARARKEIEQSLGPTPVTVDEIIRSCQMSPAVVSMVLLELELAGRLERHSGNQVSLIFL